jgi:hypothetical protein
MPVPSAITDLSQTAASNSPADTEVPTTADDYFRTHASFIALLRDGKGHAAEVTVASAGTADIGAANSLMVGITGTTTITSFGTNYNGPRLVRFAGALTLTHHATNLILPGAANITTAAGDAAIFAPTGSGWRCISYERASGVSLIGSLTSGTATAVSGTSVDFTSIPSWVKRITLSFSGVSTSGTSNPLIQIGDSGGVEATGYLGAGTAGGNAASPTVTNYTTGFGLPGSSASNVLHGAVVLTLIDASAFTWAASGTLSLSNAATYFMTSGSKSLSAALDRIRLTTVGGTDTFDAGTVNVLYE